MTPHREQFKQVVRSIVHQFELGTGLVRIGIVVFSSTSRIAQPLTEQKDLLFGIIDGYSPIGER